MNLPGHLAVSALLTRRLSARGLAVLAGTVTPDVLDKGAQLSGLTPYGRTVGHSVLLWAWVAGLVALGRRRVPLASAFLLGGAVHLLTDFVDDLSEGLLFSGYVFSAWMGWPLTNPDMANLRVDALLGPMRGATTPLELLTVLACLAVMMRGGAFRSPPRGSRRS